ncbi:hypothetical protein C0J52_26929, partial [Blattella germanica]
FSDYFCSTHFGFIQRDNVKYRADTRLCIPAAYGAKVTMSSASTESIEREHTSKQKFIEEFSVTRFHKLNTNNKMTVNVFASESYVEEVKNSETDELFANTSERSGTAAYEGGGLHFEQNRITINEVDYLKPSSFRPPGIRLLSDSTLTDDEMSLILRSIQHNKQMVWSFTVTMVTILSVSSRNEEQAAVSLPSRDPPRRRLVQSWKGKRKCVPFEVSNAESSEEGHDMRKHSFLDIKITKTTKQNIAARLQGNVFISILHSINDQLFYKFLTMAGEKRILAWLQEELDDDRESDNLFSDSDSDYNPNEEVSDDDHLSITSEHSDTIEEDETEDASLIPQHEAYYTAKNQYIWKKFPPPSSKTRARPGPVPVEASTSVPTEPPKKRRCFLCDVKKGRMQRQVCDKCKKNVCSDHSVCHRECVKCKKQ